MELVQSCQFCSKINFDALRNPLVSDIPALKEGRVDTSRHPFKDRRDDAHRSASLGTFGELLQRSGTCRLCRLIGETLTKYRGSQINSNDHCRAETGFFGVYQDPFGKYYWTRRLSILVDSDIDAYNVGGPKKSVYYAFQPCNIGAGSLDIFDDSFTLPDSSNSTMMVFGGRKRPLQLDLQWVRRWMYMCEVDHGEACRRADVEWSHKSDTIRFIDVKRRCVVTLHNVYLSECRYVALSYVWGGPQRERLELSNIDTLAQPGSLSRKLPQTIEDAILLTDSLGIVHLWVDALCIVQDDDADKKIQIGSMGQIYGFALLTVVAASGSSVHSGLPGLRADTRSLSQEEVIVSSSLGTDGAGNAIPGLSLMTTLDPLYNPNEHYLERTPWNGRGWTMQERVLSRRVLVFMPEQVYWICREATFCEESYFENDLLRFHRFHEAATERTLRRNFRNFYETDELDMQFWKTYQNLVATYTRRDFTCQGDVFDGFFAVIQGLSTLSGDEFTWGLPRSHFEQGLLWTSFSGVRRRQDFSTLPMTSLHVKVPFPSWSWMGWIGEASVCIDDELCGEYELCLLSPYIFTSEIPEILCFEHQHNPLRLERVRGTSAVYDNLQSRVNTDWKRQEKQPVTLHDIETHYSELSAELGDTPETQLIFFWTSSSLFTLVLPTDPAIRHANIADSREDIVGSTGIMGPESVYLNRETDGDRSQHEFIVLGSRRSQFSEATLLVLQIKWEGNIAYRVNCGEIKEDAWQAGAHTWKLIALR
ncbi:heterokaryon incompatibility protein domain-containing protein [Trichoderma ceciliae]